MIYLIRKILENWEKLRIEKTFEEMYEYLIYKK